MLFTVSVTNRHSYFGRPHLIPFIQLRTSALAFCPTESLLNLYLSWVNNTCVQK